MKKFMHQDATDCPKGPWAAIFEQCNAHGDRYPSCKGQYKTEAEARAVCEDNPAVKNVAEIVQGAVDRCKEAIGDSE